MKERRGEEEEDNVCDDDERRKQTIAAKPKIQSQFEGRQKYEK